MAIKVTENILIFLLITVGELISSRTEIVFITINMLSYSLCRKNQIRRQQAHYGKRGWVPQNVS